MLFHLLSMRYIKSPVRFTWQPSNVIIHSIHDRNYTQTLAASLLVLKITHEMFYCVWRHKSKQKLMLAQVTRSRPVQAWAIVLRNVINSSRPGSERQTQSRESNWLWHENRIIIIRPPIKIDLWTCQIFARATNAPRAAPTPYKSQICIYLGIAYGARESGINIKPFGEKSQQRVLVANQFICGQRREEQNNKVA